MAQKISRVPPGRCECGAHVSRDFIRVFAPENGAGTVGQCIQCVGLEGVREGWAER